MKKFVMLFGALSVFAAPAAMADHHGGAHKGKMFEKHDLNSDGVVSQAEFLKHSEEKFNMMDADGNGELSKDEAKAAKEKMHEKRKERMEKRKDGASDK